MDSKTHLHKIAENEQSTIVAKFIPSSEKEKHFESEDELERKFIKILQNNGYEYARIKNEEDLKQNLKIQMQRLNGCEFSASEWQRFFKEILANPSHSPVDKSAIFHLDSWNQHFIFDNGKEQNLKIIDKHAIQNNFLQVIRQYEAQGIHKNRYDVSILVNGLPLVHIELKRRGKDIKEAFNQIARYGRESFFAGSGLYHWVQMFVISNGTYTKYYSNTTHLKHCNAQGKREQESIQGVKTNQSFEFTSFWADMQNEPILDLIDFAKTFFTRHSLLNVLIKYSVFDVEQNLKIMRPYQIAASEAIERKIKTSLAYRQYGSLESCGYIWHSTGSGKTLTSYKTARLAEQIEGIEKVLFVVDRKDLDYQSIREYNNFQKNCVNANKSTKELESQLSNEKSKIIVTTIQKLANFVGKYKNHSLLEKPCVFIFDECHRSQFGDMQREIKKAFKKYLMFGFTGTPIFAKNAKSLGFSKEFDKGVNLHSTTQEVFGECLHSYTIAHAIRDKNVLPFKVSYHSTLKEAESIDDEEVQSIAKEKALGDKRRIEKIVCYILENFDTQTKRNESYHIKDKRLRGFNSILACASIELAKSYYAEFQRQMRTLSEDKRLKIALIYSFNANEKLNEDFGDGAEDTSSREFLESAIEDYTQMLGVHFNPKEVLDSSSTGFDNYYKSIAKNMRERELDLLIVVNMFLTGFDATTLNTLWVDKNLQYQGLLQAFSRTNRILNSVKTFGNIVCFRDLEKQTKESILLFSDKGDENVVLLRSFREYLEGFSDERGDYHKGYKELVRQLDEEFKDFNQIATTGTNEEKRAFIDFYNEILRLNNILSTFKEFKNEELLDERQKQELQSAYLQIYDEIKAQRESKEAEINEDLVFEIELIKQVDINFDYILYLIEQIKGKAGQEKEKELSAIRKMIDSSFNLRNKKDLIEEFIASINPQSDINNAFSAFVKTKMQEELNALIKEYKLNETQCYAFINRSFENGYIEEFGEEIEKVLPSMGFFGESGEKKRILKAKVLSEFKKFYERFKDIAGQTLNL